MDRQIPIQSQIIMSSEQCISKCSKCRDLSSTMQKEKVTPSYSYIHAYIPVHEGYYTARAASNDSFF